MGNMPSRQHWLLWAQTPPDRGESAPNSQSFVGEGVNVALHMAAQLRSIHVFDVTPFGPRAEGQMHHLLMVADRPEVLHQPLPAISIRWAREK